MISIDIEKEKKHSFDFNIDLLTKKIAKEVFKSETLNYDFSLNVKIVNKTEIKKINKNERGINKITDVLSFPNINFEKPSNFKKFVSKNFIDVSIIDYCTKTIFLGDVILCYDKIIYGAKKYGHSIKREFSFLLTHSILHLLGYDHEKKEDEKVMFYKQEKILDILNIKR